VFPRGRQVVDVNDCHRLHYIPLSDDFHEVYNVHAYFSGPPRVALDAVNMTLAVGSPVTPHDGDARLRRIARAGKQWRRTIGRNADMEGEIWLSLHS
jgi:hypothetical protein